jgi:hypothetical protein
MSLVRCRTVWFTPEFEADLEKIGGPDQRRSDEFVDGAVEVLAREPITGTQLDNGSAVWFLPMAEFPGLPLVWLYYTFDAHNVVFLRLQITE